jgi:hypothetical protein
VKHGRDGRLLRHCRILHHHAANGYIGKGGDDRTHSISRILDMIEGLEIDPRQIVAAIEGQNVATIPTPPFTPLPSQSSRCYGLVTLPLKTDRT